MILRILISSETCHLSSHFLGYLWSESLAQSSLTPDSCAAQLVILFPVVIHHYSTLFLAILSSNYCSMQGTYFDWREPDFFNGLGLMEFFICHMGAEVSQIVWILWHVHSLKNCNGSARHVLRLKSWLLSITSDLSWFLLTLFFRVICTGLFCTDVNLMVCSFLDLSWSYTKRFSPG